MSWLDLHMHSQISLDGEFTPERLAEICRDSGIKVAALSDHNSVRGVERMMTACSRFGIRAIPATELDCTFDGVDLHLLGYGIDFQDSRYRELEEEILTQKKGNSTRMMKILKEAGILFDEEKVLALSRDGIVVGETIAEAALADDRNTDNPLLVPYRKGGERADNPYVNFFWDYCAQGKPAYLPVSYPSFEEAQKLITETGGISVIAHPINTVGRSRERIGALKEKGAAGLEVYSSYHEKEDIEWFHELVEELELLETMGSDFHGKTKPSVYPGRTGADETEAKRSMEAEHSMEAETSAKASHSIEEECLSRLDYLLKMQRIF